MGKPSASFYHEAKKIWETVVKSDSGYTHQLEQQLEFHKRLLNIFQAGKSYYLIFNIFKGEIEFISKEVKDILGYEQEELTATFLMNKIHPEDKAFFLNFEYRITQFFKPIDLDKVKNYKVQYDYRLKAKNNKYIRVLHQAVQLDYDATNFYRTLCVQTDISHIKTEGIPCFSIIGFDGEPSFYNIQDESIFTRSYDLFTRREREILKCIVEGMSSIDIATALYISIHTVNTHRKNILIKAKCKSPLDLVTKAIHEGWV